MFYIRDPRRICERLVTVVILCAAIAGCSGTDGGGAPVAKGNTGPDASATGTGTTTTSQSAAGSSAGSHGAGGSGFKLPPVHLAAPHVDVRLRH